MKSIPYSSIMCLENDDGKYAVVHRRDILKYGWPGGGSDLRDRGNPLTTNFRELFEELGISLDKVEIVGEETLTIRDKKIYIHYAKMKKPEKYAGWISTDQDIAYYEWMDLEKIKSLEFCPRDLEIMCHLYNKLKFKIAA